MKKISVLTLLSIFALISSCKKDEVATAATVVTLKTTLSGANEVPAVTSTATGDATATYDKTTKILTLTINYSGMTATAWHIHKGAAGVAGGVLFNFGTTFSSPFNYSTIALTTDQESDLLMGQYYVNIHSAKAPGGEIRGNLVVQ